jgi:hypothetical protein
METGFTAVLGTYGCVAAYSKAWSTWKSLLNLNMWDFLQKIKLTKPV